MKKLFLILIAIVNYNCKVFCQNQNLKNKIIYDTQSSENAFDNSNY